MAKKRKRSKKKKNRSLLKQDTMHSLAAITLILCGLLVIVSLSGQGQLLSSIYTIGSKYLGLGLLFVPFLFFSAGLVMFRGKWAWSRPHTFLGAVLVFIGFVGAVQAGSFGETTFVNIAALLTPVGSYFVFSSILVAGILVLFQTSFNEVAEHLEAIRAKRQAAELAVEDKEPDQVKGQNQADDITTAMQLFRDLAPDAGTYANEADYFMDNWQNAFWGSNYKQLLKIKKKYDPDGLFVCHHCVGSERWSDNGMCRL